MQTAELTAGDFIRYLGCCLEVRPHWSLASRVGGRNVDAWFAEHPSFRSMRDELRSLYWRLANAGTLPPESMLTAGGPTIVWFDCPSQAAAEAVEAAWPYLKIIAGDCELARRGDAALCS